VNLPGIQSPFVAAPDHSGASDIIENADGSGFRHPLRKGEIVHVHVDTESYVMRDLDVSKDPEPGVLQCGV